MSIIINPFIVSGKIPEAYFCDRVAESCELEKSLTNQLNVVLTSSRRMGKTSLVTSSAFNKKHRLRSPSSTQSAALKLLEYDLITRMEETYSLSDPLLSLWLDRK